MTEMTELFKLHDEIETEMLKDGHCNVEPFTDMSMALFGLMRTVEENHQISVSFATFVFLAALNFKCCVRDKLNKSLAQGVLNAIYVLVQDGRIDKDGLYVELKKRFERNATRNR